jgi:hypothetical protein
MASDQWEDGGGCEKRELANSQAGTKVLAGHKLRAWYPACNARKGMK